MSDVALDHVGVVTGDLGALAAQYERLGFRLTPFARQSDGRIGNRCAMLNQSYIELLAVADPHARSATLERFLARYAGVHILAFAIEDTQAVLTRLQRAGVAAPVLSEYEREVDSTKPEGRRARFAVVHPPDQPEGRINLVWHLTREALWQDEYLDHPNKAVGLDEVVISVAAPVEAAARFSRLIGCPAVPDSSGSFALDLVRGRVRMLLADADDRCVPWISGIRVRTGDGNVAVGRLLSERTVAHRHDGDALVVCAAEAGGVTLRFLPA